MKQVGIAHVARKPLPIHSPQYPRMKRASGGHKAIRSHFPASAPQRRQRPAQNFPRRIFGRLHSTR